MHNFLESLDLWLAQHCIGRKPRTQQFNREIAATVRRFWPSPEIQCDEISPGMVLEFGQRVAHYSPARWNAIVSAVRFITPHGKLLSFRRVSMRQFTPPDQMQFKDFLAECDRDPRSQAGLVVRFLCLTGLRISEARSLTWAEVRPDCIHVPAHCAKSGRARSVPKLAGLDAVLERLRVISNGEHVLPRSNAKVAITSACRRAGLPPLSHHCFRHYFATRCIESGVDVPTVARWLGHQDGGALLSKTYFHLLDDHSRRMAQRVSIAA